MEKESLPNSAIHKEVMDISQTDNAINLVLTVARAIRCDVLLNFFSGMFDKAASYPTTVTGVVQGLRVPFLQKSSGILPPT